MRSLQAWGAAALLFCSARLTVAQSAVEHGAAANRDYAAVFRRSDKPCMQDTATIPYVECMDKELHEMEAHLDAFVADLRGVTASPAELEGLNQTDTAWRAYRESMCTLPLKRSQGTIRGPMSVECRWTLGRQYMQQLSGIYILSQFPGRMASQ